MPELMFRSAAMPGDAQRLRALAGALGMQPALDRHLRAPRYRPGLTRLAERAGALVGAALLSHRRLQLGAASLDAGALVWLPPPGGAEALAAQLGDCLGVLVDEGLPLVLLEGDAAALAPFGCALFRLESWVDLPDLPGPRPALRPASAADVDDLAALYDASYAGVALHEARAAPDWRAWLADHTALVLEDGRGRVVAYAAPAVSAPSIAEAAAADAGAARLLLRGLLAVAGAPLRLLLPPAHPLAQAALQLGGTASQRAYSTAPAALAGVVDLPGLLAALAPELERRLAASRYSGWGGSLRIELEAERVTLAFEHGRATVFDGTRPADVRLRQVALPALAQLCLGYRSAADLRATGELACDDAALGLIDALFSPEVSA
ncbi:sterol carrier protein domain-containing protein [Kouleothrix sp.]|uniref:sterol carrier protein domain-containing protein n=1 Tax=Kouleothrix sp. TaxID=2779161 RepID=UPI00391C86AE